MWTWQNKAKSVRLIKGLPADAAPGLNVQQRKPGNGRRRERRSTLEAEQSTALREKLLTAVGSITSADNAVIWAREALTAKNRLSAADAKLIEDACRRPGSERKIPCREVSSGEPLGGELSLS